MKKYLALFRISWQNALEYRAESALWIILDLIPLVVVFFLWTTIYADKQEIKGFTLPVLVTYYIIISILANFVEVYFDLWLTDEIREGKIVNFLLRPIDFFRTIFILESAGKLLRTILFLPVLFLIFFLFKSYLVGPQNFWSLVIVFLVLALGYLMFVFVSFLISFAAFWMAESKSLIHAKWIISGLFSGSLVPLAFLPVFMQKIAILLPFRYLYDFPASIYLGKIDGKGIFMGIMIEGIWILALWIVAKKVWQKGIRKFSAVGG